MIWEASNSVDVSYYILSRSESENGDYTVIANNLQTLDYYDKNVDQFKTYYYKLQTVDYAGNVSDYSAVASGLMKSDTEKPKVSGYAPENEAVIGTDYAKIAACFTDNVKLNSASIMYSREAAPDEYIILSQIKGLNSSNTTLSATLPISDFNDTEKINVKFTATDSTGNESEEVVVTYVVDKTPPEILNLNVSTEDNITFDISWNTNSDNSATYLYRCTDKDSEYKLIGSFSDNDCTYSDNGVSTSCNSVKYLVKSYDFVGNFSEAESEEFEVSGTIAATPIINCSANMSVGVDYIIDGSLSTDDREITKYEFSFSDGTTAEGVSVVHRFSEVGTYQIKLTVTDNDGNVSSTTKTVTVSERSVVGKLTVTVVDENNKALPNAPVYLDLGESNEQILNTDSNGKVEFTTSVGTHTIASYKDGYLPVKKSVTVLSGENSSELTLVNQPIVTGEFEIHRMTLNEIIAAGIDINAAENQHVVKITVTLQYTPTMPVVDTFYWNGTSVIGGGKTVKGSGGSRKLTPTVISGSGGSGSSSEPSTENIQVAYVDVPVEFSVLKEFFDVKLHILNNASSEFSLCDNIVTLNVPDGLTVMNVTNQKFASSEVVYIDEIKGQTQETINWVVRGDKAGEYEISADFAGTLSEFNVPVNAKFVSDEKIKVEGVSNLDVTIEAQEETEGTTVYYNVVVTNNSNINYYNYKWLAGDDAFCEEFISIDGTRSVMNSHKSILKSGESFCYHFKTTLNNANPLLDYTFYNSIIKDFSKLGTNVTIETFPREYFTSFEISYKIPNTENFKFTVVDDKYEPIKDAKITIDTISYITDENGEAVIDTPEDSPVGLTVEKDGYFTYQKDYYEKYCIR